MRTGRIVRFEGKAREQYQLAESMINEMWKKNPDASNSMAESFQKCWAQLLRILMNYGKDEDIHELVIFPDFVKASFEFAFTLNGSPHLNGGMILHGFEETFSVELVEQPYPHWSIHT